MIGGLAELFCRKCGVEVDDTAAYCTRCGCSVLNRKAVRTDLSSDKSLGYILPVGVSGLAIAAGYLGLFSVLLLPAPIALVFGVMALKEMKRDPRPHGKGRAIFGILMGSVFSLVLLVVIVVKIVSLLKMARA